MKSFIITDIGSTTTKALWIANKNGRYRLLGRAESPTTVESPYEDVTIGVSRALKKLEKQCNQQFEDSNNIVVPTVEYYSSSSAGGGLQVLVIGLFSKVTAISAQKAALGAGAILLDVISNDDKRTLFERIEIIRQIRPDMILLTGGLDGGDTDFVVEFSDVINSANPQPRFGETLKLPVIFAGNKNAIPLIKDTLGDNFDLHITDNIRPEMDLENLQPARRELHELFLSHVMQQAPGYPKVTKAVKADIMPTPLAFGYIISELSRQKKVNILSMDIGGATTDIFSVINNNFNRTVSANYGMSYSVANVMQQCGIQNIKRWLPFEIDNVVLEDIIGQKMLYPTSLPNTVLHLMVEQAVAREAIKLSVKHHSDLIRELPQKRDRGLKKLLNQSRKKEKWHETKSLIDMSDIGLIIGSGGVLSHAPKRNQAALMLIDSCKPQGVTRLAVDSVFMMPHLGVLAQNHPEIALQVLNDDCFIPLGTVISGTGNLKKGEKAAVVSGEISGKPLKQIVNAGELKCIKLTNACNLELKIECYKGVTIGKDKKQVLNVLGDVVGLIIDMRDCCQQNLTANTNEEHVLAINAFTQAEINEARRLANEISRDY
ncbi:glutamate mutase L [Clostridium sp. 'deep sea']|uniref:glutamate mutase L n=1 Tax=Clostridium sp. 'deep sea' TaxID=2779445 RepID=UPI0018969F45|nr:glutamate mutase L [Clostridium sp. 'deep sea']QOR34486.1 glutamate mutase L [Clostridium sp. 'deep sea']